MPFIEDIAANDIYIICLSDTFLDSSIPIDENRLSVSDFSIMRADLASNIERNVFLHYIEHLPIIHRNNVSNLKECLVQEISNKKRTIFPHMLI